MAKTSMRLNVFEVGKQIAWFLAGVWTIMVIAAMWNSYPIWRGIGWLLAGWIALWVVTFLIGWIVRAVLNIPADENSSRRRD